MMSLNLYQTIKKTSIMSQRGTFVEGQGKERTLKLIYMNDLYTDQLSSKKRLIIIIMSLELNIIHHQQQSPQEGQENSKVELAYDDGNLDTQMEVLNQQQMMALQFNLQNKAMKREAEREAMCTVSARREQEKRLQLWRKIQMEREIKRNTKIVKNITIVERINQKKKIDLDELLTQIQQTPITVSRPTEHEHRFAWLQNSRLLGF